MIRISNIKLKSIEDEKHLKEKIIKKLRMRENDLIDYKIYRRSLDARKKDDIFYSYTIDAIVKNEDKYLQNKWIKDTSFAEEYEYSLPDKTPNLDKRPVVIGFGPAGMFCALILAQKGLRPVVFERGEDVANRVGSVEKFWAEGILNEESNVQFGEGGAGTFSDGKLTTRIKDPRCKKVLEEFTSAGASEEIMFDSKPHIGTDKLICIVKNIRGKIISLGGEINFDSRLTNIMRNNGTVCGVEINKVSRYETDNVVLAIGHSSRDTFELLYNMGINISQKPFAIGVRIEHLQSTINMAQFGENNDFERFGAAEYKLAYTTEQGRSVYTFCVCPGGHVVGASSEKDMVCTNGMSKHKRDGKNTNSALVVQVRTEDFNSAHPLAGMYLQRDLEKSAFYAGGGDYSAPVQLVGDFLNGIKGGDTSQIQSTYLPGAKFADLNEILPRYISEAIKEALPQMGKKIKDFDSPYAVLTGVETRSSSPIRINRDKTTYECLNLKGLYPAGEGAGYAGGIVSSAVDGIIIAEKIIEAY